jgi:hypothetical protein
LLIFCGIDVLPFDLHLFEGEAEEVDKAEHGYSRDRRSDCKQLILALVVSYEVFEGKPG